MTRTRLFVSRTHAFAAIFVAACGGCADGGGDDGSGDDDEDSDDVAIVVGDLRPERVTWAQGLGPDAREHGAAFVSDDGARVYVFGGSGYPQDPDNVLNDGWILDVAAQTWSTWAISGDVPVGGARRGVQLDGEKAVLFGGYLDAFAASDEAFLVDLNSGVFTAMTQQTPPPARSLHVLAYDKSENTIVAFGGFGDDGVLGDTWVADVDAGTASLRWSEVQGAGPSPRYGAFAGIDEDSDTLVVFSGAQNPRSSDPINAAQDVWTFSITARSWQPRTFSGAPPPGRRNGCGVFDPTTHALLIFGGTADGATSEAGTTFLVIDDDGELRFEAFSSDNDPPLRSSGFGATLPGGGVVCGFGNDDATFRDLTFWKP